MVTAGKTLAQMGGHATAVALLALSLALPTPQANAGCDYSSSQITLLRTGGNRPGWRFNTSIVYAEKVGDQFQVHSIEPDGTGVTCLTCGSPRNNDSPEWSPDGNYILFLSDRDHPASFGGGGGGAGQELYVMNPDGSGQVRLTVSPAHATNYHAHFSNDGTRVLWTSTATFTWDMMIADFLTDGTGPRLENVQRLTHDTSWYEAHDWSSDDSTILFTDTRDRALDGEIYTMDLADGTVTRLTDSPSWDEHAHYSPDGTTIAWMSSRHRSFALDRFASDARPPLLDFLMVVPGAMSGFLNPPVGREAELFLMDADGSNVRQVTSHAGVVADLSWSPDGHSIVYRLIAVPAVQDNGDIMKITFDCQP